MLCPTIPLSVINLCDAACRKIVPLVALTAKALALTFWCNATVQLRAYNCLMQNLDKRIALVTGASRGIGAAIAVALAEAGADVAVNYRERADAAQEVCAVIVGLGRRALAVKADVSVAADVRRMITEVETQLGAVDVLVNNAGIAQPRKFEEISEADWDEILTVNLKSVFLVTQAVVGGMRKRNWGRVINLSSVAAQTGGAVGAHYAASKAGMIGLTHSCAASLVKEGVTVNAIAPALIETEMVTSNINASPKLIPMGHFGSVDDVSSVAVMLATNDYMTGQTISVNGGWYMS
jgi:3-oxoacyl-[acyl-carrier protein] reductase